MKVIIMDSFIDICVDLKKYNSYKREMSKLKYIERILKLYMESIIGTEINGMVIRDVSITSNQYWGNEPTQIEKKFSRILNVDYSKNLVFRIFCIDLIALSKTDVPYNKLFFKLDQPNKYDINISCVRIR